MNIAWCPEHRGVMRIAFFDPPTKHFNNPCPRCQASLVQQVRNKYEDSPPDHMAWWPDEVITKAPIPLCQCCYHFKVVDRQNQLCSWCDDCPTGYCDVPRKYLVKREEER